MIHSPVDSARAAQHLETLIAALESSHDSSAATAREFARLLLDLHKTGLTHLLQILSSEIPRSSDWAAKLAADPIVQSVLMLHDLHPIDIETRVRQGIARLDSMLAAHGVEITEFVLDGSRLRLDLKGLGENDRTTFRLIEQILQTVLLESAPDLHHMEIRCLDSATDPRYELPLVRSHLAAAVRH